VRADPLPRGGLTAGPRRQAVTFTSRTTPRTGADQGASVSGGFGPGIPEILFTQAAGISQFQGGSTRSTSSIPHFIRLDFAYASRSVFYAMAIFMAVAAIVALVGLRSGRQEEPRDQPGAADGVGRAADEDDATAVQPGRPA
jgi:hypothetical protein